MIPSQRVLALSKARVQSTVLLFIVSEATSDSTGFALNDLSVDVGTKLLRNTFDSLFMRITKVVLVLQGAANIENSFMSHEYLQIHVVNIIYSIFPFQLFCYLSGLLN